VGGNDEGLNRLATGKNRMEWYYETDGQPQGPVSVEEFLERVREGVIGEETLVWRKGMVDWMEYETVSDAPRVEVVPPVLVAPPALPVEAGGEGADAVGLASDGGDGPAWERDAGVQNVFARLGTTCAEVMMDTERCFRTLRRRGNLGAAIAYSVIAQVIGLLFFAGDLWVGIRNRGLELVLRDVLPRQVEVDMAQRFLAERMSSPGFAVLILAGFLLVNLVLIPVQSALISGLLHLNLRMIGIARHPFETTFRAVSYLNGSVTVIGIISSVTSMLAIVLGKSPSVAAALIGVGGMMWMLFVGVTAMSETHGASRGRVAVALFLIPLEVLLLALVLALVIPLVMAVTGGISFGG
jgi:hypothetical protein